MRGLFDLTPQVSNPETFTITRRIIPIVVLADDGSVRNANAYEYNYKHQEKKLTVVYSKMTIVYNFHQYPVIKVVNGVTHFLSQSYSGRHQDILGE